MSAGEDPQNARVQTAAGSLSPRDLWMPGQRPVVYRPWPGGVRACCLLAWCLRVLGHALTDGGRSCRPGGPAFGACPRVPAVPAQVVASAAAIGHHLVSTQADAAHPAGFGVGLLCPVPDRTQLVRYGLLVWKIRGTRRARGAGGGHIQRRGRRFERWVLSPGSLVSQRFVLPLGDLGCARVIWPAGLHVQTLPAR